MYRISAVKCRLIVEKLPGKASQSGASGVTPALIVEREFVLSYHRGTETILVVDDVESLRNVVVELLGQLGYRMLSAANGLEALKVSQEYSGKIDLLLTDVAMDGLPGPELAEKLLQNRPEMKVVFISGHPFGLAPDGILKPGTVLVQKPFTIRVLSAKLREVLEQTSTA
jgi:two-component system, cell cycle sensor histidine kinase and response regulator CckA